MVIHRFIMPLDGHTSKNNNTVLRHSVAPLDPIKTPTYATL